MAFFQFCDIPFDTKASATHLVKMIPWWLLAVTQQLQLSMLPINVATGIGCVLHSTLKDLERPATMCSGSVDASVMWCGCEHRLSSVSTSPVPSSFR